MKKSFAIGKYIVKENLSNKILNGFPELVRGSMPTDDGNFELNSNDIENLVQNYPYSEKFIKPFMSGGDYLNGNQRWCLWIKDSDLEEANCIPFIQERLNKVKEFRLKVALYTGLNEKQIQRKYPELLNILDFIKTGKWISSLGGLDKLKTNQILKDLRSGEILNKYFLH